ncbi:MAG: ABC transporter permease, partial [Vicinamibacterales bacterium]
MKTPQIRYGLIREVIVMAFDTVRTNKLRSGLTVLGVVIGITSIVAMTSLIRGFDASLEESLQTGLGANTIYVQRFGITSFASGREFSELTKRPVLTVSDARALQGETDGLQYVNIEFGRGPGPPATRRVAYGGVRTRPILIFGTTEFFAEGTGLKLVAGRFLTGPEIQYRSKVTVLGNSAYQLLFAEKGLDPIGKTIRVGSESFVVVGVFDKAPSPGGLVGNPDDFAIIPYTTYQSVFGLRVVQNARGMMPTAVQFSIVPRSGVSQKHAIAEIERVMRSRHRLRLDEANDFDIVTQDALMQVWNQISQATFFAL